MRLLVFLLFFTGNFLSIYSQRKPEQIHISFTETLDVVVTWSTKESTSFFSSVKFGRNRTALTLHARSESKIFVDGGAAKRYQYIHEAKLTNLKPETTYYYKCGSWDGWSEILSFKTVGKNSSFAPRFAIYGDFGLVNPQSLPRLIQEAADGHFDAILHVGDLAYDMDTNNSLVGDEFMKMIQPVAASVPYMTCPGNHENQYNFSNYVARFSMPGRREDMFYSFNIGPAHIISLNTEFYYYIYYGIWQIWNQYNWLKKDLEVRRGYGEYWGLEKVFHENHVDLEIWAHEHSYERLWPVYDMKVYNGSTKAPYTNPKAAVHVVTGSAGCQERHDHFVSHPPRWSAFRSSDYGYSRMTVHNKTHLSFQQVSDDKNGTVIDEFTLIKTNPRRRSLGLPPFYKKLDDVITAGLGL